MTKPTPSGTDREDERWYGRRFGRKLSARRQRLMDEVLPKMRIGPERLGDEHSLGALFDDSAGEVWMEIGFGAGEHLAGLAARHPDVGFIGCEPFVNGVASLLAQIEEAGLENVRIYDDDVRPLLTALSDGAIQRLYLLYSDPWPKKRHHRRRLTAAANLEHFARLLAPGGEFRFATDHREFAAWTLERVLRDPRFSWPARCRADWTAPPEGWIATRYETKAKARGLEPVYLTFQRIDPADG